MSTIKPFVSYEEIINTVQADDSGFNDFENYIRNFLIPELDKYYFNIKPFLKQRTRLHFYNIKKGLIDLLNGPDEIRLVRPKKTCENVKPNIYDASMDVLNFLNFINIFIVIMKCKLSGDLFNLTICSKMSRLLKEMKTLEATILNELESNIRCSDTVTV